MALTDPPIAAPAALPASGSPHASRAAAGTRGLSPSQSLVLLASIVVAFLAASSAPSPLYALYREAWGFSALMLTLIFAVYAFALLAGLLVFGGLSDHIGRRPVLVTALLLELGSVLLFRFATDVSWLLAARSLQGLATGIATATLSAALLDLNRERGALVNSVAPMLGMALGALGAGAIAQYADQPAGPIFDLLFVLLGLQLLPSLALSETAPRRDGAWQSLKPRLAVPAQAWSTMRLILPMNSAQWALGGFFLSLGPSLARSVTGLHAPLIGASLIATLVLSGAVSVMAMRGRPPLQALRLAAVASVLGLLLTLWGVRAHGVALLYVGSAIAGIGFGAGFNASVRSLVPLAPDHQRGAMMAAFFVFSYLAFSMPALLAGLAVGRFGLEPTALGFAVVLLLLCAGALWAISRAAPRRSSP